MLSLIRWFFESLVRLYHPKIELEGAERIPSDAPLIFVANHPNGLLDPMIVRLSTGRHARFLAKSTLFNNPFFRMLMNAFEVVPVYRAQDRAVGGGDMSQNERTFAICRETLGRRGGIAMFPEGVSHSDPHLKPLKTGAARIALGAEKEHGFKLGVVIVPMGLYYTSKSTFRSSVLARVGEPLTLDVFAEKFSVDERATVEELTEVIRDRLEDVVLQAETKELLDGIARVALWTAENEEVRDDLGEQHARALELLDAYREFQRRDPAKLEQITQHAQQYMNTLKSLGVSDPWAVEVGRVGLSAVVRTTSKLVLLLPFALVGALLGWLPYRLTGIIAGHYSKGDEDVLGTVKLLGGLLFIPLAWMLEAAVVAYFFGWVFGALIPVIGAACGYVSLRFDELLSEAIEALRHVWIRVNDPKTALSLIERRRALAHEVAAALHPAGPASIRGAALPG
ncbi:MAG: lysophospholipid acyltransferase family protein [Polyangiaceae bacterium]